MQDNLIPVKCPIHGMPMTAVALEHRFGGYERLDFKGNYVCRYGCTMELETDYRQMQKTERNVTPKKSAQKALP